MKRETAYKIAIDAMIEKQRRQYAFDHNVFKMYKNSNDAPESAKKANAHFERIAKAIEILEAERDYKQEQFDWTYSVKQAKELVIDT